MHVSVNVAAATAILVACIAVTDALSVTNTVNETVPALVGDPVTTPVDEFIPNPAGSAPTLTEYTYGGVPPPAVQLPLYATPTCAAGRLHANVSCAAATAILVACIAVADALSVTRTVNEIVPAVVGEPVTAPVDELIVPNPAGSAPTLIEYVYGGVPPAAVQPPV